MKKLFFACILLSLWAARMPTADFPEVTLSNGVLTTTMYLPDTTNGYYRGMRFDWAGAFKNLTYRNHEFVSQWFETYDPKLHDAINGPSEEFVALNYNEAKPGETFIKIGVGVLRKPDTQPYTFARTYEVVDYGKRSMKTRKDAVEFTHTLTDPTTGYGYVYRKTVRLTKGKPEMVLEHSLKNTGNRPISTNGYNHNFWVIDKEPTGPNIEVLFPFAVQGEGSGFGSTIVPQGNRLTYSRELAKKEFVFSSGLKGFGPTASDYDIRIENKKSGAGVRIIGDKPLEKLVYWACATTSCPEPYLHFEAAPGQEINWKITYNFYEK